MKPIAYECVLLVVLVVIISSGCTSEDQPRVIPSIGTANNRVIVVTAPDGCNSFRINAGVCLSVELVSDIPVIIRDDEIMIYEQQDGGWVLVEDTNTDALRTYLITPSESFPNRSITLMPHPRFGIRTDSVNVRFVVYGNLYQNETEGEQVSAYIDVILNP